MTLGTVRSVRNPSLYAWCPDSYDDGRYRVEDVLSASSGQGYLLRVTDTSTGAPCVLKGVWWDEQRALSVTQADLETRSAAMRRGVEAATRATRQGVAVLAVVGFFSQRSPTLSQTSRDRVPDESFVVTRLVQSGEVPAATLEDVVLQRTASGRRFEASELVELGEQLCRTLLGLHGQHGQGFAHGDLKPGNVLTVGDPAQYVLVDFDSVVALRGSGQPLSASTADYAPPGGEKPGVLLDVYAWGATLLHVASGTRPSEELRRGLLAEESSSQRRQSLDSVQALGLPPLLTRLITDSLAPKDKRLRGPAVLLNELRRARRAIADEAALREDA